MYQRGGDARHLDLRSDARRVVVRARLLHVGAEHEPFAGERGRVHEGERAPAPVDRVGVHRRVADGDEPAHERARTAHRKVHAPTALEKRDCVITRTRTAPAASARSNASRASYDKRSPHAFALVSAWIDEN